MSNLWIRSIQRFGLTLSMPPSYCPDILPRGKSKLNCCASQHNNASNVPYCITIQRVSQTIATSTVKQGKAGKLANVCLLTLAEMLACMTAQTLQLSSHLTLVAFAVKWMKLAFMLWWRTCYSEHQVCHLVYIHSITTLHYTVVITGLSGENLAQSLVLGENVQLCLLCKQPRSWLGQERRKELEKHEAMLRPPMLFCRY